MNVRNLVVVLFVLLAFSCSQQKKEASSPSANELPPILMSLLSGEQTMVSSLNGNVVLIFFTPDCDHCQREAADIQTQLASFKNYNLYFISGSNPVDIQAFSETYKLAGLPNVFFARTPVEDVIRIMGPLNTPSIFVYSGDKKLVKKFEGETKAEEIVKYL